LKRTTTTTEKFDADGKLVERIVVAVTEEDDGAMPGTYGRPNTWISGQVPAGLAMRLPPNTYQMINLADRRTA
jgi:hypothetical protein